MTPRHIGIAVEPPLLADLLVRLMKTPRRYVHRADPASAHSCDVAVISSSYEQTVAAPLVLRLPDDEGNAGVATVTGPHGVTTVRIATFDDILAALER